MKLSAVNTLLAAWTILAVTPSSAEECPWKVSELESALERSEEQVSAEWDKAARRDREIAALRRAAVRSFGGAGCEEDDTTARLESFQGYSRGLVPAEMATTAAMLGTCLYEKQAEARRRIDAARAAGNSLSENRLLRIQSHLLALRPRIIENDIRAATLLSKIERLGAEREELLSLCADTDF